MFNPQRRSKMSDILMEEKAFQLHLDKVRNIRQSYSLSTRRQKDQQEQQTYLQRLDKRRQEVKERLTNTVRRQNNRIMTKLNSADNRPEENPEQLVAQKHFNSYYNHQKEGSRISTDNYGMLNRMIQQSSIIPSVKEMKKDFKQNKRYGRMVRKLPAILKHEEEFKRQLSSRRISDSKLSYRSGKSSHNRSLTSRAMTQEVRAIETTLLEKANEV